MFTGIVTDIGTISALEQAGDLRARITTGYDTNGIDIGASIASDGVCLTVIDLGPDWYDVAISAETLSKTNIGGWTEGQKVNLERALKVGDELGGHIVSGHVDGMAKIIAREEEGDAVRFRIEAPAHLAKFIAQKGSVALDGTSLTVNGVQGNVFDVLLIQHSLGVTTWGERVMGDEINLEIDTMARYAARLMEVQGE